MSEEQKKNSEQNLNTNPFYAQQDEDILYVEKGDRRLLAYVPDSSGVRTNHDRRGGNSSGADDENDFEDKAFEDYIRESKTGQRYIVNYDVKVAVSGKTFKLKARDISTTGILLIMPDTLSEDDKDIIANATEKNMLKLTFEIAPGTMPEGYEMKVKKLPAHVVRTFESNGQTMFGIVFDRTLAEYSGGRKQTYMLAGVSFMLLLISFIIIMMRAESVIYFKFNRWLYLYSIVTATFLLSRYFFAAFYRPVKIDPDFTPGVTVIIPCFNEEEWIQRTITSCVNQDYPADKLEILVVDDCSNDKSVEKIEEIINRLKENDNAKGAYAVANRVHYIVQPFNQGKRDAMAVGARAAKHELLVFVDSDSFLDPFAVRNIVQPFKDKEMGGVSGRTDVANTYTNSLTKMQAVRYYIAFRIMKSCEGYFDAATCLSGPLSCYRRDLVLKYLDDWLNQTFLGQRATFGDDRSMTNFILRYNRTTYQDTAVCMTIVPKSHRMFLRQQMRWKRSWLRESLIGARYMWKKEPFMSLGFYMGLMVPIAAPIVVLYNLIYVPIMHRVFPMTFLVGMLMMALLMSMAQLFLRRSTTWIYGMWFCIYYEFVLLWQMPVAWFTFWKSTWGTRMTQADLDELKKEEEKKGKKVAPNG